MARKKVTEIEPPDEGLKIGYARVSTEEQSLEVQVDALLRDGCHPDHIHKDKASGVAKRRPGWAMLQKDVREGDTVVVWKLDRLSRSAIAILQTLEDWKARGIKFRSITDGIDTSTPFGMLAVTMLSGIAEFERSLIVLRTKTNVDYRKANGVKMGRDWKLSEEKRAEVAELVRQGVKTSVIAKRYRISRASVRNYSKHVKQRRPPGRPPVK